jgi:hypothetical protein
MTTYGQLIREMDAEERLALAAKPAPRQNITVRLRPSAVDEIDAIAAAEQRTRGDMIRLLLADGIKAYRRKRA